MKVRPKRIEKYLTEDGDAIVVLLCGGDKSTQVRDIQRAREYWADYRKE